ncbi:MAG: sigma 54-interacting transcriptional regulator [Deltaproteobacteria bacterium]
MSKRVLASWIGHTDLWAMCHAANDERLFGRVQEVVRKERPSPVGDGPIKTLISSRNFDEVHFLTQWPDDVNSRFAIWIGVKPTFHCVDKTSLPDPTNYRMVFEFANQVLEQIQANRDGGRLFILLSPGTPTMAAIWLLLAKTKFPAVLLQTYKGGVTEVEIPFDITVDWLPGYLRFPDAQLQQLALSTSAEIEGFEQIIGASTIMKHAVARAQRAAIRDVAVLLTGESGTGKELFARAMHRASPRGRNDERFEKFVAFNCAAIPDTLAESELFGADKGAFTNAYETRHGAFERANGGTLFLDEVGELSLQNQAKLLRALAPPPNGDPCCRVIRHVGGKQDISCDVRIITATNCDLVAGIKNQQFRDDLFYRLAAIQIRLPPLRERRKDIEALAGAILRRLNQDFQRTEPNYVDKELLPDAIRCLRRYDWPGNVRELTNVLTQAAVFALSPQIGNVDIDSAISGFAKPSDAVAFTRSRGAQFNLRDRLSEIELIFIQDALQEADGNQTKAATLLGISQQALSKKMLKS